MPPAGTSTLSGSGDEMRPEKHMGWTGLPFMFLLRVTHGSICPPNGSQGMNIQREPRAILEPASPLSMSQP